MTRVIFPGEGGTPDLISAGPDPALRDRIFTSEFTCSRNSAHRLSFVFCVHQMVFTKIGQYPSLADLSEDELKKYQRLLGSRYKELSRANGLFAHGVGIGAFVYLRRIFESLIAEAHDEATMHRDWNEAEFDGKRIGEKIVALEEYLPPFLVGHSHLYGIMSKAIHGLTEEECLQYFEMVKGGIIMILDERLHEQERQRQQATISAAIGKIQSQLK